MVFYRPAFRVAVATDRFLDVLVGGLVVEPRVVVELRQVLTRDGDVVPVAHRAPPWE